MLNQCKTQNYISCICKKSKEKYCWVHSEASFYTVHILESCSEISLWELHYSSVQHSKFIKVLWEKSCLAASQSIRV